MGDSYCLDGCVGCPCVLGLDLALITTGIAHCDGSPATFTTKTKGMQRLAAIRMMVRVKVGIISLDGPRPARHPALVAIEDYAYGAKGRSVINIGELGGVIRLDLFDHGVPYVVFTPSSVKKYATGAGNASKNEVLVAAGKRLGYGGTSNDEADALWVRALALAALGHPVVDLPKQHLTAVEGVGEVRIS